MKALSEELKNGEK